MLKDKKIYFNYYSVLDMLYLKNAVVHPDTVVIINGNKYLTYLGVIELIAKYNDIFYLDEKKIIQKKENIIEFFKKYKVEETINKELGDVKNIFILEQYAFQFNIISYTIFNKILKEEIKEYFIKYKLDIDNLYIELKDILYILNSPDLIIGVGKNAFIDYLCKNIDFYIDEKQNEYKFKISKKLFNMITKYKMPLQEQIYYYIEILEFNCISPKELCLELNIEFKPEMQQILDKYKTKLIELGIYDLNQNLGLGYEYKEYKSIMLDLAIELANLY